MIEIPINSVNTSFPPCAFAGPTVRTGRRICRSARVRSTPQGVSAHTCSTCVFRSTHAPQHMLAPIRKPPTLFRGVPCKHEGDIVTECSQGNPDRHIRFCMGGADADTCARNHPTVRADSQNCATCQHYRTDWPIRFDHVNLAPGAPGRRFNASILKFGSGYLLAWRHGWAGSEIFVSTLDDRFEPVGNPVKLELTHPEFAPYGREDPRLFWCGGSIHVAYVGVVANRGRVSHTNLMYAKLDDNLNVIRVFAPRMPNRRGWEKNWSPFRYQGRLHFVYTVQPHVAIEVSGEDVVNTYTRPPWCRWVGGDMRGGAPPVRVGDEYWHFFHDRVRGTNGKRQYRTGLYTFSAFPPFTPKRYIPRPILSADPKTNADNYADVLFVCGAVHRGDDWILSHGVHDRFIELHSVEHSRLLTQLIPCEPNYVCT